MPDTLALPYFDNAVVEVTDPFDTPEERAAIDQFLTLTPAHRLADSRHVYAYYRDFHTAVGGEDWLDQEMGVPATPQDIWLHVHPRFINTGINHRDQLAYVMLECNCDWEEEHGLMMVWRSGKMLIKTGAYDGHMSNTNAYDDEKLGDTVYAASNPEFRTYLTE